jgi:hypothetical protein
MYKMNFSKADKKLYFSGYGRTLQLETSSRRISWNGMLLVLGYPVVVNKQGVFVAESDWNSTLSILFNPGCVPGFGRTALLISSEQIKKLADIIDAYFCTHSHEDHIHPELCDELAKRKKLIVMPSEAIFRWTIRGATPSETFQSSYCKTYLNWQGVDSKKGLDNSMYFFTLSNGKTVFVRGDIYHGSGFELCLKNIAKWSSKIDYAFMTPYFISGTDPVWTLNTKYNCRFIPIHEWEFSHRPSGVRKKATQDFHELYQAFDAPYNNGRAQFLFWEESIDLD